VTCGSSVRPMPMAVITAGSRTSDNARQHDAHPPDWRRCREPAWEPNCCGLGSHDPDEDGYVVPGQACLADLSEPARTAVGRLGVKRSAQSTIPRSPGIPPRSKQSTLVVARPVTGNFGPFRSRRVRSSSVRDSEVALPAVSARDRWEAYRKPFGETSDHPPRRDRQRPQPHAERFGFPWPRASGYRTTAPGRVP
jgi:hypothetical protein